MRSFVAVNTSQERGDGALRRGGLRLTSEEQGRPQVLTVCWRGCRVRVGGGEGGSEGIAGSGGLGGG